MGMGRGQLATVSVLGMVFVAVLALRIRERNAPVQEAVAGTNPANSAGPAEASSLRDDDWRLPLLDDATAVREIAFVAPAHNPFVLSDRVRRAIQETSGGHSDVRGDVAAPPVIENPPPVVRSCFSTGGAWFAEIGGRVHRVGDSVIGYRITRIDRDVVTFRPVGADPSSDSGESFSRLRVGPSNFTMIGGRWIASAVGGAGLPPDAARLEADGTPVPYRVNAGTGEVEVRVGEGFQQ